MLQDETTAAMLLLLLLSVQFLTILFILHILWFVMFWRCHATIQSVCTHMILPSPTSYARQCVQSCRRDSHPKLICAHKKKYCTWHVLNVTLPSQIKSLIAVWCPEKSSNGLNGTMTLLQKPLTLGVGREVSTFKTFFAGFSPSLLRIDWSRHNASGMLGEAFS
jgi:hypothetical protein